MYIQIHSAFTTMRLFLGLTTALIVDMDTKCCCTNMLQYIVQVLCVCDAGWAAGCVTSQ